MALSLPDIDDLDDADEAAEQPQVRVYELQVAPGAKRIRLDVFITGHVENATRSKVQQLVAAGGVTVNGRTATKPGLALAPGDSIVCTVPKPPPPEIVAEDIPLDIVYEDEHILIVNKPAGMVTHPAFGNYTGTLVNALLHHTAALSTERGPERAGILHRLDKGTSGLLAVAKTDVAHTFIARQFAAHSIEREYQALVWGGFNADTGTIDAPLARHHSDRKKMAVADHGRRAVTHYRVLRDYGPLSLVALNLETGRTHQIRVHLAHLRHPVFGDPTYGGRHIVYGQVTGPFKAFVHSLLTDLPRQALHARTLGFIHPGTRTAVRFESDLPDDMRALLERLDTYFGA